MSSSPPGDQELDWQFIGSELADQPSALQRLQRVVDHFATHHRQSSEQSHMAFQWRHLQVFEVLGEGSFGRVYRAFDPQLRRFVALKLLPQSEKTAGWLDEARLLARVRHPNVIGIHGAELDAETAGIWMELVEGMSVDQIIDDALPPLPAVHQLISALADALAAVHSAGLLHGDVKGSNVMVEPSGHVTLLDFGAAQDLVLGHCGATASPLSAAPEILVGKPATPASDLYSVGVLLVRLLTGRYPYHAQSLEVLQQRQQLPPDLSALHKDYRGLAERLLSAEPADRPVAAQVLEEMDGIAARPQQRRKRRSLLLAFGGLASMLVAALAGWYFSSEARREVAAAGERSQAALNFLQDVVGASFRGRFGKDARVVDVLEDAHRRMNSTPVTEPYVSAALEYTVGGALLEIGRESEGLALLEASLAQLEAMPDAPPATVARVTNRLSLSLCELQQPDREAQLALLQEKSSSLTQHLPPEHPAHRARYKVAACIAEQNGDVAAAEKWLREAIARRPATGSGAQPDDYATVARLGELLRDQDRIAEAAPLLETAYKGLVEQLGPQHDMTLGTARALVSVYIQQSRFQPAALLMAQTLAHIRQRSGLKSRSWVAAANTQSIVLAKVGRYAEAVELNRQVLEVARELVGDAHSFTLTIQSNLGIRYKDAGDLDQALASLSEALKQTRDALGPTHRLTIMNMVNLAEVQLLTGQTQSGGELAREAVSLSTTHLGPQHGVTAGALGIAGRALLAAGQPAAAAADLEQALSIYRSLGSRPLSALETELHYARALMAAGQGQQADDLLEPLLDELEGSLPAGHALIVRAAELQARLQRRVN